VLHTSFDAVSLSGRIRVTETTDAPTLAASPEGDAENGGARTKRRAAGTGLTSMVLPELKALAATMGISGTGAMRKGDLIAAIQSGQQASSNGRAAAPPRAARSPRRATADAVTSVPDAAADVQPSFDRASSNGSDNHGSDNHGSDNHGSDNHGSDGHVSEGAQTTTTESPRQGGDYVPTQGGGQRDRQGSERQGQNRNRNRGPEQPERPAQPEQSARPAHSGRPAEQPEQQPEPAK
jgi:transcription termination factor Rho